MSRWAPGARGTIRVKGLEFVGGRKARNGGRASVGFVEGWRSEGRGGC